MKLVIMTIGKCKRPEIVDLLSDYGQRIDHYHRFEHVVAKDEVHALEKMEKDHFLVLCDEKGVMLESVLLAKFISEHQLRGTKKIVFLIADAHGASTKLKQRANFMLSLSKMTFPHDLAAVILFEQIYRASTILKKEKYHYE